MAQATEQLTVADLARKQSIEPEAMLKLLAETTTFKPKSVNDIVPPATVNKMLNVGQKIDQSVSKQLAAAVDQGGDLEQINPSLSISEAQTIATTTKASLKLVAAMSDALTDRRRVLHLLKGYQEENRILAIENLGATLARAQRYQQQQNELDDLQVDLAESKLDASALVKRALGIDLKDFETAQVSNETDRIEGLAEMTENAKKILNGEEVEGLADPFALTKHALSSLTAKSPSKLKQKVARN
jgi:malonyl CoA-acyl carrier protein transacylase